MHPDVESVVLTEEEIASCIARMGKEITEDFADKAEDGIVLISVLRGAAIFMADLARQINLPVEMDYMAVSSYGTSVETSGVVTILKDIASPIEGKHVIITEDILDTGLTLDYIRKYLAAKNPKSITIAAFLYKKGTQRVDIKPQYYGFECPNAFIVGYGLDYAERYRNLPYVGILKPAVYGK